ncbi:hypothetical protein B0H63DRAFT_303061 [Podospora didyma]|uniref:Rhodopsin domain-containing protein n=1 Tax=Podospora didyma TaxID=330526 RepID=A0AAE0K5N8_9PEZI|nr:hypothetical protein B0H63DRAFT_303061 [Podospora didyma]
MTPLLSERDITFSPYMRPEELAKYDFSDKSTLAPAIWRVNLVFIVLVGIVISLRIFTRAYMTKHYFVDDVLAVFAAVFTLVSASTALVATQYGLGQHVWNLPLPLSSILDNITHCVKLLYVAHIFYAAASAFTKLSIITSYLRIFPHETLRRILYGTAVMVAGIGVSAIFATIFQCKPIEAAWDYSVPDGQCFPFLDFLYANAAISIATDFILVAAPLPYFWSLNLPLRQRVVICILFGVGFIAFAASVVRIVSLRDMQGIDVTYFLVSPLNWTVIECSLGIICVSIPPMRPLFSRIAPEFLTNYVTRFTTTSGTANNTGAGARSRAIDHNSQVMSQPRSYRDIMDEQNREMDRQLMKFEMAEHNRRLEKGEELVTSTSDCVSSTASDLSIHGEKAYEHTGGRSPV